MNETLYDVIVYSLENLQVTSIRSRARPLNGSFSARASAELVEARINTLDSRVAIVEAGTCQIGDTFQDDGLNPS